MHLNMSAGRGRFRLRLRVVLLVLIPLCAVVSWQASRAYRQHRAVLTVLRLGGAVFYGDKSVWGANAPGPGYDLLHTVTSVVIDDQRLGASDLSFLRQLPSIRRLYVVQTGP